MQYTQTHKINEWVTDIDPKYLSSAQAFYLKNREFFVNIHGGKLTGDTIGSNTTMAANYKACDIEFPGGENYSVGQYSCDRTNEVYIFIFNSNTVNFIYRIDDIGCDIVYDEPCIKLSAEPKHSITQWRVYLDVKKTCKNWAGKRLIFTDGLTIYSIDVEASIATNSFTTDFFNTCIINKVYATSILNNNFITIKIEQVPLAGNIIKIEFKTLNGIVFIAANYVVVNGDTIATIKNSLLSILQNCNCTAIVTINNIGVTIIPSAQYTYYQTVEIDGNSNSTACCNDACYFVQLCVETPFVCPKARYLPKSNEDKLLPNNLTERGFQFMYRFVYYDGRKSTYSDPSSFYFQTKEECFESESGFPRCMGVRLPLGNSMVVYIELLYRTDNNNNWKLAKKIPKYKQYNNSQQQWYERQYSEIITSSLNTNDCTFEYKFCNDEECISVDASLTSRVYNPFPRGAQGFFPFKESLAFYNYNKGTCPLPKQVSDNLIIKQNCTTNSTNCLKQLVNVTVYAVIHDYWHDENQFIYTLEEDPTGKTRWFGGLNPGTGAGGFETGWGQRFYNNRSNFTAHIVGDTSQVVEMEQYLFGGGADKVVGVFADMGNRKAQRDRRGYRYAGEFFYSKATFKVPKGTRGFIRIGSHETDDLLKSTFVEGVTNLNNYRGVINLGPVINPNGFIPKQEEIFFDTCSGVDVDFRTQAFVIKDNAVDGAFANKANGISGYVYDKENAPVVGANVYYTLLGNDVFGDTTNHNGFYHILIPNGRNNDTDLKVKAEISCNVWDTIKTQTVALTSGEMTVSNITVDDIDYTEKNYSIVKVRVNDCNGQGVTGIKVVLSNDRTQITDNSGDAVFKIRNFYNRSRYLGAVVMDNSNCFNIDCNGNCNACMPILNGTCVSCFTTEPRVVKLLGSVKLNIDTVAKNTFGLKSNGKYGFGIIAKGDCGVLSFVNKGTYLTIPKRCDDKNNNCKLTYNLSGIGLLPNNIKSISIVRTKNLNPFELQWIVDKVEYTIDNKIKLTIQSLNDYNFNNFFNTNTIYQYLKGDRLEIIQNENGKYFCEELNYQILNPFHDTKISGKTTSEANYFNQLLIEDDGRVGTKIKEGYIIELQRPQECLPEEIFYTICVNLKVVNGVLINPIGTFTTFDTYFIKRKILKGVVREYEHHSPSDFWEYNPAAGGVSDIGTAHIVNEFEDEKRFDRNITISDADDFNNFGQLEKTIGDAIMGGIVAMNITDDKIIKIICENDNSIAQKADDLLRIQNGVVTAISGDQAISNPQTKASGRYGCQYEHIGSIYFGDGYVTWADVNKHAFIYDDYNTAVEASFGKIGSWTSKRFQQLQTWNNSQTDPLNKYRFSTGFNHHNDTILLTVKRFRDSGIDNQLLPDISPNETIIFRPSDMKFYGQSSATPEGYASLNSFNGNGCAYLQINNGEIWIYPIIPKGFGSFFGVPIDQVIGYSVNQFPYKIKKLLSKELQNEKMWFVHEVTTNVPNFISEIPAKSMKKEQFGKWNASYLGNKNSLGGLFGKNKPIGYYFKIIIVRDNTLNLSYNTIDNNKRKLFDSMDEIINKFMLSEQSGFTENL